MSFMKYLLTLSDGTKINLDICYTQIKLTEHNISILKRVFSERYNEEVLKESSRYWEISIGKDAARHFNRLLAMKGGGMLPTIVNNQGIIDFENVNFFVDNTNNRDIPNYLVGIAIFILSCLLLMKHKCRVDIFMGAIARQILSCITKDGTFDTERLQDIWFIHSGYFINVLDCRLEEIKE